MDIDTKTPGLLIGDTVAFDRMSGSFLERLLFNNRPIILALCLLVTAFLGFAATRVKLSASFDQMIPVHQQFIVNYMKHYSELQSQGNAIHIAVEADRGTIISAAYLNALQKLSDEVYLLPGVDRPFMTSLWTANTRWTEVTSQGLDGGPVITQDYDGSPGQVQVVDSNIQRSGGIGQLVSPDFKSSMIYVPLLAATSDGRSLDYGDLAHKLDRLRTKYAALGLDLHITGFAMIVGDLINGIDEFVAFFVVSLLIAATILFWFTRCWRSTTLVVFASMVAVVWQIGLLEILGYTLTPYSVLVPFLIFSIGMSHGAQKMNGVMQDIGRGAHPLVAARFTFRRLFLAGFAALT